MSNNEQVAPISVDDIRKSRQSSETAVGLTTAGGFELTMRIANMLSNSTMVPEQYRKLIANKNAEKINGEYPLVENNNGLPNCVIAINMANRMGADPLMIMQNLYIVEGRPAWSSQFIIAAINSCGLYSPLRFEIKDLGEIEATYQAKKWVNGQGGARGGYQTTEHKIKINNVSCVAWAIEKGTGVRLESSPITMELAVKEGWYQKNGSKWQTMPEQMLRYRAASFFGRIYAPQLLMGLRAADEEMDAIIDVTPEPEPIAKPTPKTVDSLKEPKAPVVPEEPAPAAIAHDESAKSFDPSEEEQAAIRQREIEQAEAEERARFGDAAPVAIAVPVQQTAATRTRRTAQPIE